MKRSPERSDLKVVDLETLQQHVDALSILVNLILTEMSESAPDSLARILDQVRYALDSTPQMHPELRKQLEARYATFAALLAQESQPH